MFTSIILSIIFLILLGLTIINGRVAKAGVGEKPLIYTSVIVEFFLNIAMFLLFALSIYLVFFYSWKLFLILLLIGFFTEGFIIVPIIERTLAFTITKFVARAEKK